MIPVSLILALQQGRNNVYNYQQYTVLDSKGRFTLYTTKPCDILGHHIIVTMTVTIVAMQ